MDNCKKFQDLILTDYIDGEIDQKTREMIDSHVRACPQCQRLAEDVKQNLVAPFKSVERENVPDQVWISLKEKIENEKYAPAPAVSGFIDRFIESFLSPKLVPVYLNMIVLVLIGSWLLHDRQIIK